MHLGQEQKLEQTEHKIGLMVLRVGLASYAINLAVFGYYCYVSELYTVLACNFLVITAFLTARLAPDLIKGRERQASVLLTQLALWASIPVFFSVRANEDISVRAACLIMLAILTVACVASCPDYRERFFKLYFPMATLPMIICGLSSLMPEANTTLALATGVMGYAARKFVNAQVIQQVDLQNAHEELILMKAEEQTRIEKARFQQDLALARRIQTSIRVPKKLELPDGLKMSTFLLPSQDVAGDWLAVRQSKNGTVALVVDAAGKGLQASLVVHAIQAAWAANRDELDFNANQWIAQVNRILFNLGESEPHMVTLGLIVIGPATIEYFGCGHPPAIMVTREPGETERKVHVYMGKGDVLGMKKDVKIQSVTIPIPASGDIDFILGTDGVIGGPMLRRRSFALELAAGLVAHGKEAVAKIDTNDDKALVWLSRHAATSKLDEIA